MIDAEACRLIGRLKYLQNSLVTPDINFAVKELSQFFSAPRESHLKAVLMILHYMNVLLVKVCFTLPSMNCKFKLLLMLIRVHAKILGSLRLDFCIFLGTSRTSWSGVVDLTLIWFGSVCKQCLMGQYCLNLF